jgi:hypothetical protein
MKTSATASSYSSLLRKPPRAMILPGVELRRHEFLGSERAAARGGQLQRRKFQQILFRPRASAYLRSLQAAPPPSATASR